MMAVVRRLFQSIACVGRTLLSATLFTSQLFHLSQSLVTQNHKFSSALTHSFDNVGRSFGQKLFVTQLPLVVGSFFFYLCQLFFQALAFRRSVNLLLIDYTHIE